MTRCIPHFKLRPDPLEPHDRDIPHIPRPRLLGDEREQVAPAPNGGNLNRRAWYP